MDKVRSGDFVVLYAQKRYRAMMITTPTGNLLPILVNNGNRIINPEEFSPEMVDSYLKDGAVEIGRCGPTKSDEFGHIYVSRSGALYMYCQYAYRTYAFFSVKTGRILKGKIPNLAKTSDSITLNIKNGRVVS